MPVTANGGDRLQTIRELSERLVAAQKPIRILNAISWDDSIRDAFFAGGCKQLPQVDRGYYEARPLEFDAKEKQRELFDLDLAIRQKLGDYSPVGGIMRRMCREYETVVRMLDARGEPDFSRFSQELYGSSTEVFYQGEPTLADFGARMADALENIDRSDKFQPDEKRLTSEQAVEELQRRLSAYFPADQHQVRVMLSDGIISDAAAGSDYIKLRQDATFSERDIRLLEVHEGWVHVGTTLNGLSQPVCTFLSKGPPSSTVTQEGLAILMENLAFVGHPERVRRVSNRIRAVDLAEQGANFLEVFHFFRDKNVPEQEAYSLTARVFRGSLPDGQPFTKDVSYSKGFILVYNFIQLAVRRGKLDRIPLLFCGKTTLEDMRTLNHLVEEGLVQPPKFLPPQFADLQALTSWMCYSGFLRRLNLDQIEAEYSSIL